MFATCTLVVLTDVKSSENPYRAPRSLSMHWNRPRHFPALIAWTFSLLIPVFAQVALLQTSIFANDSAALIFVVASFVYLMFWRHFCRAAYQHDYSGEMSMHDRHPVIARISLLALVAVLISSTLFLCIALITDTGPGDHPVVWLLFMILALAHKEVIVAYATTFARAADEAKID